MPPKSNTPSCPSPAPTSGLDPLFDEVRACTFCADLPLGPRPIVQGAATSRLVIASQAPGSIAHASGVPFMDPSGVRLRDWLGLDLTTFYDPAQVAIVPMGFCYPGRLPNGGDRPPHPSCAPRWRPRLLAGMTEVQLILLVGGYSQADALGPGRMTDRVRFFRDHLPRYFPLPHPSWRTGVWERRNPWFTADVLPALRQEVGRALAR
ncbi:MAG: uracil-DNA glycosylase family protein [Acetobacteraceae bacterium]